MSRRSVRAERSRERMRARGVKPIAERTAGNRAAILETHVIAGTEPLAPCGAHAGDYTGTPVTCTRLPGHNGQHHATAHGAEFYW